MPSTRQTPGARPGEVFATPVARGSVGEVVADYIRQLVFSGELRDGQRVPQREIAQALGVSSVPVREALQRLEGEGYLVLEPRRGATVASPSRERAIEVMQVRRALELRELAGDTQGMPDGFVNLGGVAYTRGDFAAAALYYERALAALQQIG